MTPSGTRHDLTPDLTLGQRVDTSIVTELMTGRYGGAAFVMTRMATTVA
jgi:hypothetical protein